MNRRHAYLLAALLMLTAHLTAGAQERRAQNKPYIDLRPLHFGVLVGVHIQDIEMQNVGPQMIEQPDGGSVRTVVVDQDNWNPGFTVGVLADLRLGTHVALRLSPTMHFGAKHLVFRDFDKLTDTGKPTETTQDMKNTYISLPLDLKLSAERFNNHRPYVMAGISPMLNLTGKSQDYIQLKRFDVMMEVGIGCDLYLPFFKLIPELKFCYGLTDAIDAGHGSELTDVTRLSSTKAVKSGRTKMIVLTFNFE